MLAYRGLRLHRCQLVPMRPLPWLGMEETTRFTARSVPGNPGLERDFWAAVLGWSFEHRDPQDGERVRVHRRLDGTFIGEGIWEWRTDQPDGSYMAVLHTDDGRVVSVPGGPRCEVVQALPRPRPPVLTADELHVAGELLEELAAVFAREDLGRLAGAVAARIEQGLAEYHRHAD